MKIRGKRNSEEPSPESPKDRALELLLDAWDTALEGDIPTDTLASVGLFVVLSDMIENHGEEFVAQMAESLPARIREGEFSLTNGDDAVV